MKGRLSTNNLGVSLDISCVRSKFTNTYAAFIQIDYIFRNGKCYRNLIRSFVIDFILCASAMWFTSTSAAIHHNYSSSLYRKLKLIRWFIKTVIKKRGKNPSLQLRINRHCFVRSKLKLGYLLFSINTIFIITINCLFTANYHCVLSSKWEFIAYIFSTTTTKTFSHQFLLILLLKRIFRSQMWRWIAKPEMLRKIIIHMCVFISENECEFFIWVFGKLCVILLGIQYV